MPNLRSITANLESALSILEDSGDDLEPFLGLETLGAHALKCLELCEDAASELDESQSEEEEDDDQEEEG
jgi:hypothetical protein